MRAIKIKIRRSFSLRQLSCFVLLAVLYSLFVTATFLSNPAGPVVEALLIATAVAAVVVALLHLNVLPRLANVLIPFVLLVLVYLIRAFPEFSQLSIKHTMQVCCVCAVFIGGVATNEIMRNGPVTKILVAVLAMALLCGVWFPELALLRKNSLGTLTLFGLLSVAYSVLPRKQHLALLLILIIAAMASASFFINGQRTLCATIATAPIVFWGLSRVRKIRGAWAIVFLAACVALVAGTAIYTRETDFTDSLEATMVKHTSRTMNSGRQIIWPAMLEMIEKSPIVGHGSDTLPQEITGLDLSAHNQYLQLILQVGLLGFLPFWAIFCGITLELSKSSSSQVCLLAFALTCLLLTLFINSFEVMLLQNNLVVAYATWFLLGCFTGEAITGSAPEILEGGQDE